MVSIKNGYWWDAKGVTTNSRSLTLRKLSSWGAKSADLRRKIFKESDSAMKRNFAMRNFGLSRRKSSLKPSVSWSKSLDIGHLKTIQHFVLEPGWKPILIHQLLSVTLTRIANATGTTISLQEAPNLLRVRINTIRVAVVVVVVRSILKSWRRLSICGPQL